MDENLLGLCKFRKAMLSIGVVGVGHLGKIHLKLLLEIDRSHVAGFYDANEEHAAEVSKDFGVEALATYE